MPQNKPLSVTIAKHAGFCFGVQRAVNMAFNIVESGGGAMLGPIAHNPQLVADLESKGMRVINCPEQAHPGERVLIRAHGVAPEAYQTLERLGAEIVDATCPDVAKIQRIAEEQSALGKIVLLLGDQNHPELVGIIGNCKGDSYCFEDCFSLLDFLKSHKNLHSKNAILLIQTTFLHKSWQKCEEILKNIYTNIEIFDTICKATVMRQDAARQLALRSDVMIVVGGRQSSNTAKLATICCAVCPTYTVETSLELKNYSFHGFSDICITAGASTPAHTIWEAP